MEAIRLVLVCWIMFLADYCKLCPFQLGMGWGHLQLGKKKKRHPDVCLSSPGKQILQGSASWSYKTIAPLEDPLG